MRRFYIKSEKSFEFEDNIIVLGEEFNHIVNVLRYNEGDKLIVIDGCGSEYYCVIEKINKKDLTLKIENILESNSETKANVTVFQALVKGDKFELIIQKLTELGVKKLVPFSSSFCQVKPNTTRLDRLEKISIEALKQCGRARKVEISDIKSFDEMSMLLKDFDKVIFAYEKEEQSLTKEDLLDKNGNLYQNVAIIIGSEGGFSTEEYEKLKSLDNITSISLGNRILRAETASISLTSVVMYLLGEWDKK